MWDILLRSPVSQKKAYFIEEVIMMKRIKDTTINYKAIICFKICTGLFHYILFLFCLCIDFFFPIPEGKLLVTRTCQHRDLGN